jgi:hypothetical protein
MKEEQEDEVNCSEAPHGLYYLLFVMYCEIIRSRMMRRARMLPSWER